MTTGVVTTTALWGLLAGVVVPMLVALVSHARAAGWVKSVLLLVLSALASALTNLTVSHLTFRDFLLSFAQIAVVSIASHFGFLQQLQVTGALGFLQRITGGKGIGTGTQPLMATTARPDGNAPASPAAL